MQSPRLPWEVIERVISYSSDHRRTMRNFSLTCHDLRPWSLSLLVVNPKFKKRNKIFEFCDFLRDKPHLKLFVRCITVDPNHFSPVLFNVLPNLSNIMFTHGVRSKRARGNTTPLIPTLLHQSILISSHLLGSHIRTLHLSNILFTTPVAFARALSIFTNIIHLVCTNVVIESKGHPSQELPLEMLRQRLYKRLQLQTLTVDIPNFQDYVGPNDDISGGELLLDWGSGLLSTVENLTVSSHKEYPFPQPFNQWQLDRLRQSLVLKTIFDPPNVSNITALLKKIPPSKLAMLKEVVVMFHSTDKPEDPEPSSWIMGFVEELEDAFVSLDDSSLDTYREFEDTLLQYPHPQTVFQVDELPAGSNFFWTQELGKHFPKLFKRGALEVLSNNTSVHSGHENMIYLFVASPNGAWVASAAQDSTIILWDAGNGQIARRWVAHKYHDYFHHVCSLAFSPNSRYLVSGAIEGMVTVWDLGGDLCKAATLQGHTNDVQSCAWSPRDDVIVTASNNTIRLWDAHTFQLLSVLVENYEQHYGHTHIKLAFSPTGHWLFSGCPQFYCIWDIASNIPHPPLQWRSDLHNRELLTTAAFDAEGACLLVASSNEAPKILDVKTGAGLISFGTTPVSDAALSPDGKLVVTRCEGHSLKMWDANTGTGLFLLEGHPDSRWEPSLDYLCFSPCGRYIAAGSDDCAVSLWRSRDGSCVATLSKHSSTVDLITFSSDGKTLWCGLSDGSVIMRRMCDIIPAEDLNL